MVDRAALEMQCTARYRGFESLPLRQLGLSRQTCLNGKPDRPVLVHRRDENPGFGEAAGRTVNPPGLGRSPAAQRSQSLPLRQLALWDVTAKDIALAHALQAIPLSACEEAPCVGCLALTNKRSA